MRVAAAIVAVTLSVGLMGGVVAGCGGIRSSASRPDRRHGEIVRVIDGDTVEVRLDSGGRQVVRVLSIDSPEKFATRYGSPRECGSLAASAFMRRFRGATVTLVADPGQDRRDRYGRLLRYLRLARGADLGALEVRRGLAMPYRHGSPARRHRRYLALARSARRRRRGTWGPPCDGDFHSSVAGIQDGLH